MTSTSEMVDSVNVIILADRRVIISVGTAYKIVHDDLSFS